MRSKRRSIPGFESGFVFGTKVETTKFFYFHKWEKNYTLVICEIL